MVIKLLICSILLVALYVGATIWKKRELPTSISEMVFDLSKPWQWIWSVWLALADILATPALLESLPKTWQFIGFLFAGSLLFVAGLPLVNKDNEKAHHYIAIAAGILSQLCVGFVCAWWFAFWILLVAIPFIDKKWYVPGMPMWIVNSRLFIIEAFCATTLYGAILFH